MSFKDKAPICKLCEKKIILLPESCFFCAEPTINNTNICSSCVYKSSNIRKILIFYEYCEPLKTILTDFKFQHGYDLANYLAHLIINKLPADAKQTQCLIPVPLHRKKHGLRGYHQTLLLAKQLSKQLKIPVSTAYCKKTVHTASQSQLSREQRHHNLTNAFSFSLPPYQKITIIDDIMTTGATIQTIASGFQALGVEHIDVWCLAKTL